MFRFLRSEISRIVILVSEALVQSTEALRVATASLNRFERRLDGRRPG